MIRLIFLGLNNIGKRLYKWLNERDDNEVLALLTEPEQLSLVKKLEPDLILSGGYRHILPDDIIDIPEKGYINLHKSFLPRHPGANPNLWTILESDETGISIHYMTDDVDGGSIIDRRRVNLHPDDTGKDLYKRLENSQFNQFKENWPAIRDGNVKTIEQNTSSGCYHYKSEFTELWEIARDNKIEAGKLIDRLRALTPPHKNAYFTENGQKYYIEISITPENVVNDNSAESESMSPYKENSSQYFSTNVRYYCD